MTAPDIVTEARELTDALRFNPVRHVQELRAVVTELLAEVERLRDELDQRTDPHDPEEAAYINGYNTAIRAVIAHDLADRLEEGCTFGGPDDPGGECVDCAAAAELRRLRDRDAALTAIEELFAGGPDTLCRTTWRRTYNTTAGHMLISSPPVECVEVPMDDLRGALGIAAAVEGIDREHER